MDADSSSSPTDSDDEPSPITSSTKSKLANTGKSTNFQNSIWMENEQDIVIYQLFPISDNITESHSDILITLQAFALNLSKDYIWHNEPFRLFESASPKKHYYFGRTNIGGNMDDEWFIVYILYEISKNFPDLVIRVTDSDGQFLLIEAADYIPSWLNGEIADNRVFVFRGKVHIIPVRKNLKPCPSSLDQATLDRLLNKDPGHLFSILQTHQVLDQTVASENIQRSIMKRIEGYAESVASQNHRANCVLPAKFAMILNEGGPYFVSAAVQAICNDKTEERLISNAVSSAHLIMTPVQFSRNLYAQLSHLKRVPDYSSIGWQLPKNDEFGFKANTLGMKLTKGLEILAHNAATTSDDNKQDLRPAARWEKFFEVLENLGYFEGLDKESKSYDMRLLMARSNFRLHAFGTEENVSKTLGTRVRNAIEQTGVLDVNSLRQEYAAQEEDDDSWLMVSPDQLDQLLAAKLANVSSASKPTTKVLSQQSSNAVPNGSAITNGDHAFVPCVIPKNLQADHENRGEKLAVSNPVKPKGLDFDADNFGDCVRRMLDLHIPQDADDSSDMDSYSEELDELNLTENVTGQQVAGRIANNFKRFMDIMEKPSKATASNQARRSRERPPSKSRVKEKTGQAAAAKSSHSPGGDSIDFEDDDFTPVDIDKSMVSTMLESYFPESCGQRGATKVLLHGDRPVVRRKRQPKSKSAEKKANQ